MFGSIRAVHTLLARTQPMSLQEVAMADVRKELSFCRKTGLKVLGVVENMSGLTVSVGGGKDFFLHTPPQPLKRYMLPMPSSWIEDLNVLLYIHKLRRRARTPP